MIRPDPEGTETRALFEAFADFAGKHVLEIGCGDGRLTWRYADRAGRVTAIDPNPERIARALQNRPAHGFEHVGFLGLTLEEFAGRRAAVFDLAILAWSL